MPPPRLTPSPGSPHLLPLCLTSPEEGQSCLLCAQGQPWQLSAPFLLSLGTLMGQQCLGVPKEDITLILVQLCSTASTAERIS